MTDPISLGLDVFLKEPPAAIRKARMGLLTNQASVNGRLIHNRKLLKKAYRRQLTTLFSPQHGFYCEKQDNMIESDHSVDAATGLPL